MFPATSPEPHAHRGDRSWKHIGWGDTQAQAIYARRLRHVTRAGRGWAADTVVGRGSVSPGQWSRPQEAGPSCCVRTVTALTDPTSRRARGLCFAGIPPHNGFPARDALSPLLS